MHGGQWWRKNDRPPLYDQWCYEFCMVGHGGYHTCGPDGGNSEKKQNKKQNKGWVMQPNPTRKLGPKRMKTLKQYVGAPFIFPFPFFISIFPSCSCSFNLPLWQPLCYGSHCRTILRWPSFSLFPLFLYCISQFSLWFLTYVVGFLVFYLLLQFLLCLCLRARVHECVYIFYSSCFRNRFQFHPPYL